MTGYLVEFKKKKKNDFHIFSLSSFNAANLQIFQVENCPNDGILGIPDPKNYTQGDTR